MNFTKLTDQEFDQMINEMEAKATASKYRLMECFENGERYTVLVDICTNPDGTPRVEDHGFIPGVQPHFIGTEPDSSDLKAELQAMLLAFDKPVLPSNAVEVVA